MAGEWRAVVGYEGVYEVSERGDVRRIGRARGTRVGGRLLTAAPNIAGYPRVTLSKGGKKRRVFVHVIVALAYIGPCPEGKEVNHKDRDRANPIASNLEYLTHGENERHKYASGVVPKRGEDKPHKLTTSDIVAIRASKDTFRALADRYGVCHKTIGEIKHRRKWRHV